LTRRIITRPVCRLFRYVQVQLDEKRRHGELVNPDDWDTALLIDHEEVLGSELESTINCVYTLHYL
jgi:hypothetical protein